MEFKATGTPVASLKLKREDTIGEQEPPITYQNARFHLQDKFTKEQAAAIEEFVLAAIREFPRRAM
jgi:hypothetical protein